MIKIYYVRHGETDWNKENRIQGHVEIPLNENGIREAEEAHEKLKEIPIDLIYSSPLKRAYQTALILRGDRDIPIYTDDRIKEMYYGEMEGHYRTEVGYTSQYGCFFKRYPGGEGYLDVAQRVYNFFDFLREKYDGKVNSILVVAHGGMSRAVNSYFEDMTNEEYAHFSLKNCQIKEYELK